MEQSKFLPEKRVSSSRIGVEHPYSAIPWHFLTDHQKAQLLLDSIRLLNTEVFLSEFKSFEMPDNYSDK